MSTTSYADCHVCKETLWASDSVSGPWVNKERYLCVGNQKAEQFLHGIYVGGKYGCPESQRPSDTLTLCLGGDDSGVYVPVDIHDHGAARRVTLLLSDALRRERFEALRSGGIEGIVHHEARHDNFCVCPDDAGELGYRCPVCTEQLLEVRSEEYQSLRRIGDQAFMRQFLPQVLTME